MDLQYLRRLVKIVTDSNVDELEIEEDNTRIKITRAKEGAAIRYMQPSQSIEIQTPTQHAQASAIQPVSQTAPEARAEKTANLQEILSPIVGTFYRAPSPEAPPFVQVGQSVSAGSPVCIIEAMKIMNEIESEISGKVVKIFVENGKPVEYNQPLFLVEIA